MKLLIYLLRQDLIIVKKKNEDIAGYHRDISFLTLHPPASHKGLYLFDRKGERHAAVVPDGCLLIQAGAQLEYVTGGKILAGYHEVIVSDNISTGVRVAIPFFCHLKGNLDIITPFKTKELEAKYPLIKKSVWLMTELEKILLKNAT